MNYTQAYNFLLSLARLPRKEYLKDSAHCDWYLKRLGLFLSCLGDPQDKIPEYIHITGTSGKGSVASMIYNILRAQYPNKKIALLSSPGLTDALDRWEINGQPMSKNDLVKITQKIQTALKKYRALKKFDEISFYEILTAIGLKYFADKKTDIAVVEVGCGGRYDSTNIIPHKRMAVITNISLDHTNILGKTKNKIAYEKAGIIKPGATVFTGEQEKKLLKIFQTECKKTKTKLNTLSLLRSPKRRAMAGEKNNYKILKDNLDGTVFEYQDNIFTLPLLGEHQIKNALLAIEVAKNLDIKIANIKTGLKNTSLPARLQIIQKKPLVILDGAHNIDKMRATVATVKNLQKQNNIKNINLLLAFSADKDIAGMIRNLATLKPQNIFITEFSHPLRACAKMETIKILAEKYFNTKNIYLQKDPHKAYKKLQHTRPRSCRASAGEAKTGDLLLVTGSLYLVGELLF